MLLIILVSLKQTFCCWRRSSRNNSSCPASTSCPQFSHGIRSIHVCALYTSHCKHSDALHVSGRLFILDHSIRKFHHCTRCLLIALMLIRSTFQVFICFYSVNLLLKIALFECHAKPDRPFNHRLHVGNLLSSSHAA